MLYLPDSSVLITASHSYYPVDAVPEYWEWLTHMGAAGNVKLPFEIFDEMRDGPDGEGKDLLFAWLQDDLNKKNLLLDEEVDPDLVQKVLMEGYAPDLTDDQIEEIGRDPFLIAYAMAGKERCVVTVETSQPKKQRQNRKIPDVCRSMGVQCCNPFEFNRRLGFRTHWKKALTG